MTRSFRSSGAAARHLARPCFAPGVRRLRRRPSAARAGQHVASADQVGLSLHWRYRRVGATHLPGVTAFRSQPLGKGAPTASPAIAWRPFDLVTALERFGAYDGEQHLGEVVPMHRFGERTSVPKTVLGSHQRLVIANRMLRPRGEAGDVASKPASRGGYRRDTRCRG